MYVFSAFDLSYKTEDAVTALQTKGIEKDAILAVPLDSRNESGGLFDTVHYSDNASTLTFPFILAMMCTLLGSVFGFQLRWGPIIWGVLGAVIGMAAGLAVSISVALYKKRHQQKAHKALIVVIVICDASQSELVQDVLWSNSAIGVNTFR